MTSQIILEDRILNEQEQKQYEDLLPYLLKRVSSTVIYEYAYNDQLRLMWAKHIFLKEYLDLGKNHSVNEIKAVLNMD